MKSNLLLNIVALCLLFYGNAASAQAITDSMPEGSFSVVPAKDSLKTRKIASYLQLGAAYSTDNMYLGRKDSVAIPYYTPSIGYYSKTGFSLATSFGFLSNSSGTHLDVFTAALGYAFSKGNYESMVTVSKFVYSSQSTSVKSELKGSVEYENSYDVGFIQPTLLSTLNIGNKLDIALTPGLNHSFILLNDKLEIAPTVLCNASTQNYYSDYYKVRRYNPKSKVKLPPTGVQSVSGQVLDAGKFKVLDYECSVPLVYNFRKCSITLTPIYAMPVHPAETVVTTTRNNGTTTSKTGYEKLSNGFFGTVEMVIKF